MVIPDEIAQQAVVLKDQYFDLKGLSVYSSLKVPTLRDYLHLGMPAFKIRGKVLIKKSEFDRWMEHHRIHENQDLDTIVDDAAAEVRRA